MNKHGGVDHIRASLGGGCSTALYYDRQVSVNRVLCSLLKKVKSGLRETPHSIKKKKLFGFLTNRFYSLWRKVISFLKIILRESKNMYLS